MQIDIEQKAISFGDKYTILLDGKEAYYARGAVFTILAKISLSAEKQGTPLLVINKKFAPFMAEYTITMADGSILNFTTLSVWGYHYQCVMGNDTYDIYGNRGLKYSIYKNNVQVAYFVAASAVLFFGDSYTLYADDDCNQELLIAFCLIIDNYAYNDNGKYTITINLGKIGIGMKKFDSEWRPNKGKIPTNWEEKILASTE